MISTVFVKRLVKPALLLQVLVVGGATVGVKLVAFLKELVVAQRFGTSDEIDAFLVALLIPMLVASVAGDAFRDGVVPAYAEQRARKNGGANRLISNIFWICVGTLLLTSLVTLVFGDWLIGLIGGNFAPEKSVRSLELLYLISPFGIAFGAARVLQGYLQADGRFALSSAAPAIVPMVTIALLLLMPLNQSAALLAVSMSLGAIFLVLILWLSTRNSEGARILERPGWDTPTRLATLHSLPLLAGAAVMEGCFFVDTMMAAWLPQGSVAVLSYGERICSIVLSIGGTAAGFVLFPHVSDLAAHKDWKTLRQVTFRFSSLTLIISLPFVGFLWILAEPIVRLLLERGEFTPADTARVAEVLRFAALQVPGYILAVLGAKVIMALRANRILFVTTVVSLALNVGLNLLFIEIYGVKGIALSTAFVSLFSAALLFAYFALRIRRLIAE